ncbi:MAG: ribosome maturation factor RimP [Candidatus Marinimicrobia bacterium]|nr:ribosome maturation factor RimP [Candidatus Neomarinimicrobiota bacterium]
MTLKDELKTKIEAMAESRGLWIEDIRMSDRGGGTILILCDKEGGIQFADLQQFSKDIQKSEWFDESFSEHYDLEVSSPGLDFPLSLPRHFVKNRGRLVKIHHTMETIPSPIRGNVVDATESMVILHKEGSATGETLEIPLNVITEAKVKIKW